MSANYYNLLFGNLILPLFSSFLWFGCDTARVYENHSEFTNLHWHIEDKKEFDFVISDTSLRYNINCNLRNSLSYPYSRLFVYYHLFDSTRKELNKNMVTAVLFDIKTGRPLGKSGLGDLFDHSFPLLKNHHFPHKGKYTIQLTQFMRQDSLQGIFAVGVRVEKNSSNVHQ